MCDIGVSIPDKESENNSLSIPFPPQETCFNQVIHKLWFALTQIEAIKMEGIITW